MYRYETHLHTYPVSRCAKADVAQQLAFYKSLGYDGVFITNHFIDGNINIDRDATYEEKIRFYFSDYEKGLELGKQLDIQVFCGVELSCGGTDFLVYGLDKEWFLAHPEITEMKKSDELRFMADCGALIIQAHPFREASYIDHIRLFPRQIHGVETVNTGQPEEVNQLAEIYARHYGLLPFGGSDDHSGANHQRPLAGVLCREPVADVCDFIEKVKRGQTEVFVCCHP